MTLYPLYLLKMLKDDEQKNKCKSVKSYIMFMFCITPINSNKLGTTRKEKWRFCIFYGKLEFYSNS